LAAAQQDLGRFNERHDSFKQMAGTLEQLDGRGNSLSAKLLGLTLDHKLKHGVQPTEIAPTAHDYFDLVKQLRKDAGL